eukprot:TRINITY_DN69_c0_g1_i2.p1 TRINITY_DN69_c0_g1~~TRINITY_DN69_c0_g1_i2.p1  ORF type:complete len:107 (+),score=17.58 TRINITY_DN69_c0_g1_i2:120-440(+)
MEFGGKFAYLNYSSGEESCEEGLTAHNISKDPRHQDPPCSILDCSSLQYFPHSITKPVKLSFTLQSYTLSHTETTSHLNRRSLCADRCDILCADPSITRKKRGSNA